MNDLGQKFVKQAEDFFAAAGDVRMPEGVQQMAEDNVARSRAAFAAMTAVAKDGARTLEQVTATAQSGARTLGEKVLANVSANTEAAFTAAEAMARSRSLPEVAKVQAEFMQSQMVKASEQTRELLELSGRIARDTFETFSAAAQKGFETVRKAG